ncbi:zinc finger protein VAR3, chloroplastic-like isoform X2 [Rhodamnia argentea]|uniref:Zinc finger protein VAR3, chloroplastic-like isoform X2 n=1 Tax=Rhodamnia argentea TaxID=178133 RepID=A0A8B8N6P4_9MYRT|nr:zinc finger protein VAR3, chloroplastic-like isoform X2 [Rhodamnia argentea]
MGGATRFLMFLAAPLPQRCPSFPRLARLHHHCRQPRHLSSLTSRTLHHHILGASTHRLLPLRIKSSSQQFHAQANAVRDDRFSDAAHPWPEWLNLIRSLSAGGYMRKEGLGVVAARGIGGEAEFVAGVELQEEFLRAAEAGLAFASDRPHLLRALSKRDIEVVVENGAPFLFRNADDSIRKMRAFMSGEEVGIVDGDKAQTIDLMRFILSYACSPTTPEKSDFGNRNLIASVRNLLQEMANPSNFAPPLNFAGSLENQFSGGYGQIPRPRRPDIEMKRGDWICPRCSFMNFARNMKCLECEEARPKRQLTGREWECPQCDFFNYGRNQVCLKCECKRPGEISSTVPSGFGLSRGTVENDNKIDFERRLAANAGKAPSLFNKVSQVDGTTGIYSAIADEDFPETMPPRQGMTRSNLTADGTPNIDDNRTWNANKRLDSPFSKSSSPQQGQTRGNNSGYVPFVPLPADMFAKKPTNSETASDNLVTDGAASLASNARNQGSSVSGINFSGKSGAGQLSSCEPVIHTESQDGGEENSERWFRRIAELHDARDLPSATSDEHFPETMPMHKRENRSAVGRMKDHTLTSPTYKRRAATEQGELPLEANDSSSMLPNRNEQPMENQHIDGGSLNIKPPVENSTQNSSTMTKGANNIGTLQDFGNHQTSSRSGVGSFQAGRDTRERTNLVSSSRQPSESLNVREQWRGKSLEGSAVKEPNPLDMSEEAKAERWFRRVAQIKDISELSQIPDEDFPSIMPMRKGVNRFVVSKRKTPLERRLTSSQYRRNLPVVTSEPVKNENENK